MTLIEALTTIGHNSTWAVYAEKNGKFKPDSRARFGQKCFENGGLLDGFQIVATGDIIGDDIQDWSGGEEFDPEDWFEQFIEPYNA